MTDDASDRDGPGPNLGREADSDAREGAAVATVEVDGVHVRKSIRREAGASGLDRPAVRFDVAATGDGGRTVRLVERLPPGVDPDALRFDAEYAGDGWRPARPVDAADRDVGVDADPSHPDEEASDREDDAAVEFRTVLGPGDDVTTYYVPPSSGPALDDYDSEPRLTVERLGGGDGGGLLSRVAGFFTGGSTADAASAPTRSTTLGGDESGVDDDGPDDGGDGARATESGPTDADTGQGEGDGEVAGGTEGLPAREADARRVTTGGRGGGPADDSAFEDDRDGEGEGEGERPGTAAAGGLPASLYGAETVGDALAAEVEAGRLEPGTLRALADDAAVDADRAVRVRVERLETRVSELEAYAGALESFLVDEGTPGEVREALSRLDDLAARVEATASDAEDARRRVETVEGHVEELATGLEAEDDAVVSLQTEVERLREEVESLAAFRHDVASVLTLPGDGEWRSGWDGAGHEGAERGEEGEGDGGGT